VKWFTISVSIALWLLAPIALLSSFEVIVLTGGAFPTSIREHEVFVIVLLGELLLCFQLRRLHSVPLLGVVLI
jgi:hypothetical protein